MSRFGFTGAPRKRSGFLARFFSRRPHAGARTGSRSHGDKRYTRTLTIDPLETRCLLSVTPADLTALIVNQTYGSQQETNTQHSIASDNAGDFVVAWTRQDPILSASGQPIIDPATGIEAMTSNVYARYFTNTVQRVTLPAGTNSFSLTNNDQTIDQISITAGTPPAGSAGSAVSPVSSNLNISGTFDLFYNATGKDTMGQDDAATLPVIQYVAASPSLPVTFSNSAAAPSISQKLTFAANSSPVTGYFSLQLGSTVTNPISYDSTDPTTTAANIENALQAVGYTGAAVTVDGSSTATAPAFDVTYTGTQSDLLSVDYFSGDAALAASEIQTWLNGFAPVTGVSDGTHAVVNTVDQNTLMVDFGPATQGLDQSALLQYVATPLTTATQDLTFAAQPTTQEVVVNTTTITKNANPPPDTNSTTVTTDSLYRSYPPIEGTIALQVGTVQTALFAFDDTTAAGLATTASNMQTALQNAGFAGATVTATPSAAIISATESGSTVTITTATPVTGLTVGTTIVVSGVTVAGYNGTFTVVSANGNTVTYTNTVTGLAASSGGTISWAWVASPLPPGVPNVTIGKPPAPLVTTYPANCHFTVTFASPEPAVQYIPYQTVSFTPPTVYNVTVDQTTTPTTYTVTTVPNPPFITGPIAGPLLATYSNDANTTTWTSGYLPAVQVTTLDKPFTSPKIPASPTDGRLTAEAISSHFSPTPIQGTSAVGPFDFPPPGIAANVNSPYPYMEPVAVNPNAGFVQPTTTPFVAVTPVANTDGTPSATQFDVTFSGISGTTVQAPMVVTNAVDVYGNPLGTTILGSEGVPTGSTNSSVSVIKQSGNEFQVNPQQAENIYTGTLALNADQPAVAMDGAGDFVIAWRQEVSQQLAPKNITDVYFRRYAPIGVNSSNVPGQQYSDVAGSLASEPYFTGVRALASSTQRLTLSFNPASTGPFAGVFELQVGSLVTAPINFTSTDLPATAANIQAALASVGYAGATVSVVAQTVPTVFSFDISYDGATANAALQPVQYVGALPTTVTFANSVSAPAASQTLTFNAATLPVQQLFAFQIGNATAGPIAFDSTNLANTAAAMQTALVNAGYSATVSADRASTATSFIFDVVFSAAQAPIATAFSLRTIVSPTVVSAPPTTVALVSPATVAASDPYTQQANVNYTNPQYDPAVAMGSNGQFVVVWANRGQDLSWFNNISMIRYDANGNAVAYVPAVSNGTLTNYDFAPYAAIGYDGNVVVTWTETSDVNLIHGISAADGTYAIAYSAQTVPLWNAIYIGGGGSSTVSMDGQDNFLVSWEVLTGTDPNGYQPEAVLGAEYQLESYTNGTGSPATGTPLAQPVRLRPPAQPSPPIDFRYNSASTNDASTTTWPIGVTGVDGKMDVDGDIAATYDGNGPAVSQNIEISSTFFEQYFTSEQQQLTFAFPAGVTPSGYFALQVGATTTGAISFSARALTTAINIQAALSRIGFTTATVTGSLSGNTYTFTVSFRASPYEPVIGYVGALSEVTFANSVSSPNKSQQLTFTPTSPATTLNSGLFELSVGTTPTVPIYFDGTSALNTANSIQNALLAAGFTGVTVTADASSTATSFVFDVAFTSAKPPIQYVAAPALPSTLTYAAAITTQWYNADLLPYFDPFAGDSLGYGSYFQFGSANAESLMSTIYAYDAAGGNVTYYNENVDSAIDQVLFAAQYTPDVSIRGQTSLVATATPEQLGRLRAILENVAGKLRGEGAGILLSQWDANAQDSQDSTYSDNVVSTQRAGQDQRYYIVVPADVQSGSFSLRLNFAGENVVNTTAAINVPSTSNIAPGGPIDTAATENNIAAAINAILGTVWPNGNTIAPDTGSVAVRCLSQAEITARSGTVFAVPNTVITAEGATQGLPPNSTRGTPNQFNAYVFELTFQGQAHDEVLSLSLAPGASTQQWISTNGTANNGSTTPTYSQAAASSVAVIEGDYQGDTGQTSYGASLSMTSAGSMNVAYTYQPTDENANIMLPESAAASLGASAANSAMGLTGSNVYVEQLSESTDTAGPRVVGLSDSNGINLLNPPGGTATSVNSAYFVLTFDEPMLSVDPATNPDSVYNLNSYQVYDAAGNQLAGAVAQIHYGLNEVAAMAQAYGSTFTTNPNALIPDNKWEAVLTLSDKGQPLPSGTYTIKVLNAVPATASSAGQPGLRNAFGTPLNLTGFNPGGANFTLQVTFNTTSNSGQTPTPPGLTQTDTPINSTRGGLQIDPAVATSPSGNYVIVWTSTRNGNSNIVGQLYNATGLKIGAQFTVNTTASTSWGTPDVAMDTLGDFAVVWSGAGPNSNAKTSPSDIYARVYNYQGQPVANQFQVDQYVQGVQPPGVQNQPRVAMGPTGTIVVTWTSTPVIVSNTNTANSAIFAREFNKLGAPLSSEFQVTVSSTVARSHSDVAMDANNDFIVTWEGDFQNSSMWGVYGKYFTSSAPSAAITSASETGSTVTITTATATGLTAGTTIVISGVPVTGYNGTFTVASVNGTTFTYNNVITKLTASSGGTVSLPISWSSSGEMLLNNTPNSRGAFTLAGQTTVTDLINTGPRVAMYPTTSGNRAGFAVTWSTYVTANGNFDVFAQLFNAGGSARSGAFMVNETPAQLQPNVSHPTIGWQLMPAVSIDMLGHITVVWTSFGQDNAEQGNPSILDYGIYARLYNADGSDFYDTNLGAYPLEFRVNATTLGNQVAPAVASYDPNDNSIIAWVGPDTAAAGTTAIYSRVIDPPAVPLSKIVPVAPTIRVADTTVAAGTVPTQATFTVSLSTSSSQTITVKYATANGSAAAGVNYTAASGTLTFSPGQTTKTVTVTLAGMTGVSGSKTFTLSLSSPSNGTLGKSTATATVTYNAPQVTQSPSNQTFTLGQSVTFTAAATGAPAPTVQWQVSTDGVNWTVIAGATKSSYTFTPTAGMSGTSYRAVFTNSSGSVATSPATLLIASPPTVTTSPSNQAVNAGTTVTLKAAATGMPNPTVQWQVSTDGVNWTNIPGATTTTYSFTAGTVSGNQYRAVFTNSLGTAKTSAATLTIHLPPVVTTSPVSQTTVAGTSVKFTAAATGAATVQWQVSTNGTTWSNISGATATSYTVTATAAMSGYQYQAVFTNSYGLSATAGPARLTVNSAPAVTTNPASQTVMAGSSVTLTAAATGTPSPTVQWQMMSVNGTTWSAIPGATSSTYAFTATAALSGTQYRAVFTNSVGTATTAAAKLTVNAVPVVTTNPANQTAVVGSTVTFTAAATGATSTQWQFSANGTIWSNIGGAVSGTYSLKPAIAQSGYKYRAVFTNSAGSATTTAATLTVGLLPVVLVNPVNKTVTAGAAATFTALASATPTPTVQWQVSLNGTTWTNISGANAATYTFTPTTAQSGYQYRALFTNSIGSVTSTAAKLTVNAAPGKSTAKVVSLASSAASPVSAASLLTKASLSAAAVDAILGRRL